MVRILLCTLFLCSTLPTKARQIPDDTRERIYQLLSETRYPNISKSEVRTGTCFLQLTWDGEFSTTIWNSLGTDFDYELKLAVEPIRRQLENVSSFDVYIPVTFLAGSLEYTRVHKPDFILDEVKVQGRKGHRKKYSSKRIQSQYRDLYRNGDYSKALRKLDDLILLDPYRTSLRLDRMKIVTLLGDPQIGCNDYIILTTILNYRGVPANPCPN